MHSSLKNMVYELFIIEIEKQSETNQQYIIEWLHFRIRGDKKYWWIYVIT